MEEFVKPVLAHFAPLLVEKSIPPVVPAKILLLLASLMEGEMARQMMVPPGSLFVRIRWPKSESIAIDTEETDKSARKETFNSYLPLWLPVV
jgi:hypothetical protein